MWFPSSGDCLLRTRLLKKKKEKGKKKRSEGCRKNRPACSCAQQHVPRILEKLDIPQSSASRMSSREIYKGLRASLPRCLSHHVILYGGVLFPTKGGVAWWALKHRSQSLSQDATWIRRDSFSFSLCVHIYIYLFVSFFRSRHPLRPAILAVTRNGGQERREFIARARFFRAPEVARLRLPVKNSALHSSGCACKLSKFFSFFLFFFFFFPRASASVALCPGVDPLSGLV